MDSNTEKHFHELGERTITASGVVYRGLAVRLLRRRETHRPYRRVTATQQQSQRKAHFEAN